MRIIRRVLETNRGIDGESTDHQDLARQVSEAADAALREQPEVVNATGTILHTNLGRAPLSAAAQTAALRAASTSFLELDPVSGARASRQDHVEPLLRLLLDAPAAHVAANNAAALLLTLRALASRREVVVSRGELVEIGDGFRLPDIIRESGARLVEVGTTNRTTIADYAAALGPRTAAILQVHPSNFAVVGFAERPQLRELAGLAHEHHLPLLVDNGSGALVDTAGFGLAHEPMPAEALTSGADLVMFSTDKLLGGPQGGVIAGKADLVAKVRRHPLARAVRPDKLAVAALRATLTHYVRGEAGVTVPVIRMLALESEAIRGRALDLADMLARDGVRATVEEGESVVGGGSLPGQTLPTALVRLSPGGSISRFAAGLRDGRPPVVARVQKGHVAVDLRTVPPDMDAELAGAINRAWNRTGSARRARRESRQVDD